MMKTSASIEELENISFGSNGALPNSSFATERFERFLAAKQSANLEAIFSHTPPPMEAGDDDWEVLTRKIDSKVRMGVEFYEYPQHLFAVADTSAVVLSSVDGAESPGDLKVFLGGMRFELVQMGKHAVTWLIEVGCKVTVNPSRILIHRRARNGRLAPTGCASVFVSSEADAQALLSMNQRIFCGVRGLFVAQTPEQMAELVHGRSILDIVDGRVRGPTHPIVIEKAYSSSQTPSSNGSFAGGAAGGVGGGNGSGFMMGGGGGAGGGAGGGGGSPSPSQNPSFAFGGSAAAGVSKPPPPDPGAAQYHRFQGFEATAPETLAAPTELFVGGLCYEATQPFVAWMFSLMGVPLHPNNVTLYIDPSTGVKRGCAQIRIEESDFDRAMQFNKRILCDTHGAYLADSPHGIQILQASRDKHSVKGPTHPVVIERRRNNRATPSGGMSSGGMSSGGGGGGAFGGGGHHQHNQQHHINGGFGHHHAVMMRHSPMGGGGGSPHHHLHHMHRGPSPPQYGEQAWLGGSFGAMPPINPSFPPMMVGAMGLPMGPPRQIPTPPMFQPPADPPPPSYARNNVNHQGAAAAAGAQSASPEARNASPQ